MFAYFRRCRGASRKKLIDWAKWCFIEEDDKFNCKLCHVVQKDHGEIKCLGLDESGICPEGKIPYLMQNNYEIWRLFRLMIPGIMNGMGGYDYVAIDVTFNQMGVVQEKRKKIFPLIIKLIETHSECKKKN